MRTAPIESLCTWMSLEYAYSSAKFGESQGDTLRNLSLSNNASFGGQAASYWARMRSFDDVVPNAYMQQAQMAAKLANTTRSLWAAVQSIDRMSERVAAHDALQLIDNRLSEQGYQDAKIFEGRSDFWETPIGLGFTYLEAYIREHGLARKFRLGHLVRVEQIMNDAAAVAALQFERCLSVYGALPRPGVSSGNIEPWSPATD